MMFIIFAAYFLFRNWSGSVLPLIAVGGVAVVGMLAYRAYRTRAERRRAERIDRADVAALREQVESMLADTANRVLDVEGRPGLVMSTEANDYFQRAVSTFVSVDEKLDAAVSTYELRSLLSELEDALWRLGAAQAILDGRDLPTRPEAASTSASRKSSGRSMSAVSLAAVSRWIDGGSRGSHHGRRRSC